LAVGLEEGMEGGREGGRGRKGRTELAQLFVPPIDALDITVLALEGSREGGREGGRNGG